MKIDFDALRARAHASITKLPGKAGALARKANDALGRPLADATELAERRAFDARGAVQTPPAPTATPTTKDAAPVIVYHMDKTRRDALQLVELLAGAGIVHEVSNIQEDPAAQAAVRRDSRGFRLPVVFVAGEPIGGRTELTNMLASGALKKKVYGSAR